VLGGLDAGLTVTVNSEVAPAVTRSGFAAPVPVGASQTLRVAPELRGAGASTVKSAAFWSVSMQPPPRRCAAVVWASVSVGPLPSRQFAPP
jgi:hypothetical protein